MGFTGDSVIFYNLLNAFSAKTPAQILCVRAAQGLGCGVLVHLGLTRAGLIRYTSNLKQNSNPSYFFHSPLINLLAKFPLLSILSPSVTPKTRNSEP